MQTRFFWKLGLTYLLLLCAVLLSLDLHAARVLHDDYLRAGFDRLGAQPDRRGAGSHSSPSACHVAGHASAGRRSIALVLPRIFPARGTVEAVLPAGGHR